MNTFLTYFFTSLNVFIAIFAVINLVYEVKLFWPKLNNKIESLHVSNPGLAPVHYILTWLWSLAASYLFFPIFILIPVMDMLHGSNKELWDKSKAYRVVDVLLCIFIYALGAFMALYNLDLFKV